MAYKPQYYPGNTSVAKNRRKYMSGELEKLRDISDDDLTAILGHRAPGSDYPSTHPPLSEIGEPDCPIREIVEPTPGAAAGDRVRYVQFSDSMYNAPATPYWRSYHAAINFRGVDPGTLSGRQVNEMRERDLENFSKRVCETEMTDWGLAGMRGCTVHGHCLRLQEDGTMFDMLDRRRLEGGVMVMDKDQVGVPIDRKVNLGKPMSEAEAAKRTTIYRVDNVPFRSDKELIKHVQRVWALRTQYGFYPAHPDPGSAISAAEARARARAREEEARARARAREEIAGKYEQLGGSGGFLGSPISDVKVCPDYVGYYQHFQNGSIYWHPKTGAHEIHGDIRQRWANLGWERGFLGYPLTDESSTPIGNGQFQRFQGGSIYWTPETYTQVARGSTPAYVFRLDKFHIDNTRALDEDSDKVTFALKVGDLMFEPKFKDMGDVDNGDHKVDLEFGPIPIDDATPVLFNYQILNSGHGNTDAIRNSMMDAAKSLGAKYLPTWAQIATWTLDFFIGFFIVDCDGPVAGDQISVLGATLNDWTSSTKQHSETSVTSIM